MKRRFSVACLVTGLAVSVAACAGGDESLDTGRLPRVEVSAVWSGSEQERFMQVLDEFTARTGIVVDYIPIPGSDVSATLEARAEAHSLPDVALLPQPALLRDLACREILQPLPPGIQQTVADNFAADRQTPGRYDGQLYGVWFKAANKSLVWFNPKVLRDAKIVEPPTTWAGLLEAADMISASGVTPVSLAGKEPDAWVLTDWFENVYLRTAGPDKYDQLAGQDKQNRLAWTDPSVAAALQQLARLWAHQPDFIVGGAQGALDTTFSQSIDDVFENKAGAMVFEGDFVAARLKPKWGLVGQDIKFFSFPAIGSSADSVVAAGDIAVMTKDTTGARELMTFLASASAGEIWARQGGFISPNRNVSQDVYPDVVSQLSAQAWSKAAVVRFDLSDQLPSKLGSNPRAGLWKELRDFLRNPSDVDEFGKRMEKLAGDQDPSCE